MESSFICNLFLVKRCCRKLTEGLGSGVWGLRSNLKETPKASDLPTGVENPDRARITIYRVLRDTVLARKIKILHNHACQLCGEVIELNNGEKYSEAHHIIPLGSPHNGPDTAENIIVLCPNHHVLCDYGVIKLDKSMFNRVPYHSLSVDSIKYHNEVLFNGAL